MHLLFLRKRKQIFPFLWRHFAKPPSLRQPKARARPQTLPASSPPCETKESNFPPPNNSFQLRSLSCKVTPPACQEKEDEEGEGDGNNKEQNRKENNVPTEAVNGQVKSRVAAVESNKTSGTVGSPEFSPARGTVASGGQSRHGGLKHSDSRWPSMHKDSTNQLTITSFKIILYIFIL